MVGITKPISPSGDAYAFLYCYALGGIYHDGMVKLFSNEDSGGAIDIQYLDNVNYGFIPNSHSLDVFFSLDSIIIDDGFGPWPNESRSLLAMTNTFKGTAVWENLDESLFEEFETIRTTILLNTMTQSANSIPVLSNEIVDIDTGKSILLIRMLMEIYLYISRFKYAI